MVDATRPQYHPSTHLLESIDGYHVPVTVSGPDTGRVVIMLDEAPRCLGPYALVRERLHVAAFRIIGVHAQAGLTPKCVVNILDQLEVTGGLLVGDGYGGELAWKLAATQRHRFTGMVVVDSGHPKVPGIDGKVRDTHCPTVELDTTILVGTAAFDRVARASRRYVHGEFRLVEVAGVRGSRHFTAQLTTEIVMRALSR
ncbi:alpha/beta hydrolase [Mycolicibacterium brisbanense]|uniref:Alpha/beta hydrolase n=1 Tax=Mycolicibacterium brisbanense TaxID=146020 RepID=A0A100W310_9MYCO|nr:alpha/beta hydrolase [Mycolicibacterium brisbanense]MCV7156519.1 alpha/beta hydrolase [Mycolicibacterium brisbanense]GAS90661.1 uncharacterized protein RMCB_4757 [Mycolicibacterium brisbanense]